MCDTPTPSTLTQIPIFRQTTSSSCPVSYYLTSASLQLHGRHRSLRAYFISKPSLLLRYDTQLRASSLLSVGHYLATCTSNIHNIVGSQMPTSYNTVYVAPVPATRFVL